LQKILYILFFLYGAVGYSQSNFQLEFDVGYAFQEKLTINNEEIENIGAFGLRGGFNYLFSFKNKMFIESGVYGKFNRSKRKIQSATITFNDLRLQTPLYVGYRPLNKFKVGLGASIENNVELDDIEDRLPYNVRCDILTKVVYEYINNLHFSLYTHWMVSTALDVYTLSSPKNGVYLGLIYQFGKRNKQ